MKKLLLFLAIIIVFLLIGFFGEMFIPNILNYLGANKDDIDVIANAIQIISFVTSAVATIVGFFYHKKLSADEKSNDSIVNTSGKDSLIVQKMTGGVINIGQDREVPSPANSPIQYVPGLDQKTQDELQECVQKYLIWTKSYYSSIELRGIKRGNEQVVVLDVEKAYYPLYADLIPFSVSELSAQKPISVSLKEILKLGRNIVVTGASGCGKTIVLRYIAYILSKAILERNSQLAIEHLSLSLQDNKGTPIPFILPLSSYSKYLKKVDETIKPPNEKTLPYFIYYYLVENHVDFNIPQDIFWKLIREGHVILLLDGLDEIPDENLRTQVIEDIEQLSASRENLRIVVSCRSAAYVGGTIIGKGFREVRIKPLLMMDVKRIIELAYNIIYKDNAQLAQERVNDIMKGIENLESDRRRRFIDAKELVSSPLIVRLLIILHYSEMRLPEQRAKLYMQATDRLLYPDTNLTRSNIVDNWTTHRDMLQHLAFYMHSRGPHQGKEVSEVELRKVLLDTRSYDPQDIEQLIHLVNLRSSVLEESGGTYRFIHMGFQEYLTARYLAEIMMSEKAIEGVTAFLEENVLESWWREPILLLMGYLSCDKSIAVAVKFISRFAGLGEYERKKKAMGANIQLASIEVAIASLLEWPEASLAIRKALYSRLARILKNVELMSSAQIRFRAEFGRSLGRLGDPRFDANLHYLPKTSCAGFVKVPGGKFQMGSDLSHDRDAIRIEECPSCEVELGPFYISKYPVTVDQFRVFLEETKYLVKEAGCIHDKIGNHPVVFVSWKECLYYCEWLTKKLRTDAKNILKSPISPEELDFWQGLADGIFEVKLPSEAEWEKAARGDDGRIYPWGNKLVEDSANFGGESFRTVMAVGLYPSGASPLGILDMSGNVWEWTRSALGSYPYRPAEVEDLSLIGEKIIRGGSYYFFPQRCRCASRYRAFPDTVLHDVGFRIIVG